MSKKWVWSSGHLVDVSNFPEEVGVIHSTKIKDEDKRLIEGAPDLLEALEEMMDALLVNLGVVEPLAREVYEKVTGSTYNSWERYDSLEKERRQHEQ